MLLEGEDWFDLFLTAEEWSQIKPVHIDSKRSSHTLKPYMWTDIISTAFWKQHRLPCAYFFKRAEVNTSLNKKHFLKISGQCGSDKCKNLFYGIADKEPTKDCDLFIRVKTRNTTFTVHEDIRRPLRGLRRKEIAKECANEGCANILKKLARQNLNKGDTEGPIIPTLDVLRHAKNEYINKDLNIQKEDRLNPIETLYKVQFEPPFMGCIQDVAYNPFFLFYGTPEQISIFQQYCTTVKKSIIIIKQ